MNKEHTLIRLVDDDESLLFSTKILLEALGWKVAAYNSPTEFLVRDNLSIPGCAVLDVRMPQMPSFTARVTSWFSRSGSTGFSKKVRAPLLMAFTAI